MATSQALYKMRCPVSWDTLYHRIYLQLLGDNVPNPPAPRGAVECNHHFRVATRTPGQDGWGGYTESTFLCGIYLKYNHTAEVTIYI